ncbi:putative S-adenosyl-L-methionine-dependent methyltransferase [Sporotomaculum syntrophicum]|uniref:S-adenosyl-L-methionine-dependent methyltransferase n=1 Tax=Sporotomaculum syntrophicum TaxID=182264 RepID=A0A9D2WN32_9FIRM|nr:SAM-dependent methyltransferase [Sporotomaculum syntrophicum]KAF1084450.1 putative S-adenosyl-L-methionine-dependent methyltransferase [Sporotomaculum syntrophicum]
MEHTRKASETAVVTASLRALACYEDDADVRGKDELAALFLPEEKSEPLKDADFRQNIKKMIPEGLYEFVTARTAYFDDLFVTSLQAGIPQIVILGAGYDSRPYRFKNYITNTMIYEVDTLATQELKKSVLQNNGITSHENVRYVALDFEQDDLIRKLCAEGFNPALKTLFIWEGVTFYLQPDTVRAVLQALRANSALHSLLCFDYQTVDQSKGLVDTGLKEEIILFGIEAGKAGEYLQGLGYTVLEQLDAEELDRRYLTCRDGSLLGNIKSMMHIVKAEMAENVVTPQVGSVQGKGRLRFHLCQTLSCLMEKNIRSCYECDEFPCPEVQEE